MIRTGYLTCLFDQSEFLNCVTRAKTKLKNVKFEAFAITGNSGTIMGGALSLAMKKKLILVRKEVVSTHATHIVEGDDTIKSYVFLDDFVCTGETRNESKSKSNPRCRIAILSAHMNTETINGVLHRR